MHATYEAFIAESGLLDAKPEILCIECQVVTPEPGCDHCANCLAALDSTTNELLQVAA